MDIKEYITKYVDYLLSNNLVRVKAEENCCYLDLKNDEILDLFFFFCEDKIYFKCGYLTDLYLDKDFCKQIYNKIIKYKEEYKKIILEDNTEFCIQKILSTKPIWEK